MKLNYGDILRVNHQTLGSALYMVVNPPIVCEHCGRRIEDWCEDENGKVFCPYCSLEVIEFKPFPCPCGENDMVTLVVAANNNFHESNDGVVGYNHMVNVHYTFCRKSIENDIAEGRIHKCTPQEACQCKRLILWTSQEDFDETKEIPQWIQDTFPMPK